MLLFMSFDVAIKWTIPGFYSAGFGAALNLEEDGTWITDFFSGATDFLVTEFFNRATDFLEITGAVTLFYTGFIVTFVFTLTF